MQKETLPGHTITGRLLESNTNPVPVKNYSLHISQKDAYGLSRIEGLDKIFSTGNQGWFSVSSPQLKSSGVLRPVYNTYPLSISGIDKNLFKELHPFWNPITPNQDTSLGTIYLYKKIEKFVRKIQFNSPLLANDSIEIYISTTNSRNIKIVYGPQPTGATIVVDTINQLKTEVFDFTANSYFLKSTLVHKPSYIGFSDLTLPSGDENYREQILIYP